MDKKPKAGDASRKAKKQKIEDKEQSERFIETAREIAVDENPSKLFLFFKKMKYKKYD